MEIDPIDDLRSHPQPPEDLERRVVAALQLSGAIRQRRSRGRPWLAGAAAALIFVAGMGAGRLLARPSADAVTAGHARYLLLLAGNVAPAADGASHSEEYGAWARSLSVGGVFVRGAELDPAARVVGARPDTSLGRDLASVGGYFIIEAATEADAVRLAESCPHVKYGGVIHVRRLL